MGLNVNPPTLAFAIGDKTSAFVAKNVEPEWWDLLLDSHAERSGPTSKRRSGWICYGKAFMIQKAPPDRSSFVAGKPLPPKQKSSVR
jgi:hypothetical protein